MTTTSQNKKRKASEDPEPTTTIEEEELTLCSKDLGHRRGNFHNYYQFHPVSDRLEKLQDLLTHVTSRWQPRSDDGFRYCDLGCNEGNLTMEIATALQEKLQTGTILYMHGMDIDPVLIQRAEKKWETQKKDLVKGIFQVADILNDLDRLLEDKSVDLISLLSTTMW